MFPSFVGVYVSVVVYREEYNNNKIYADDNDNKNSDDCNDDNDEKLNLHAYKCFLRHIA